jgi:hypothetical protein
MEKGGSDGGGGNGGAGLSLSTMGARHPGELLLMPHCIFFHVNRWRND